MKASRFYDNNRQRFSATIAWFPFGHNTIIELCDRYSCRLICKFFKKDIQKSKHDNLACLLDNFRFTAEELVGTTSGSSFRNKPVILVPQDSAIV